MENLVALVFLGLVAIGIAAGVAINLYLYSRGAFGTQHIGRSPDLGMVTLSQETLTEEDYYMSLSETSDGSTLRQVVLFAFVVVIALSVLVAFLFSVLPH